MADNKVNIPNWLNSVLITILILVAGASFFQNRQTHRSVQTLEIQVAVLSNQLSNHEAFGNAGMEQVDHNTEDIAKMKTDYVTRQEFLQAFETFRQYVSDNYERKK